MADNVKLVQGLRPRLYLDDDSDSEVHRFCGQESEVHTRFNSISDDARPPVREVSALGQGTSSAACASGSALRGRLTLGFAKQENPALWTTSLAERNWHGPVATPVPLELM